MVSNPQQVMMKIKYDGNNIFNICNSLLIIFVCMFDIVEKKWRKCNFDVQKYNLFLSQREYGKRKAGRGDPRPIS